MARSVSELEKMGEEKTLNKHEMKLNQYKQILRGIPHKEISRSASLMIKALDKDIDLELSRVNKV